MVWNLKGNNEKKKSLFISFFHTIPSLSYVLILCELTLDPSRLTLLATIRTKDLGSRLSACARLNRRDVINWTCPSLWRKVFILLQEFIGFSVKYESKAKMKWKRYSYWFFLPYCSKAKFLTIRSHSPFNLIVQIYKCRLSILWMRWMCEDAVVDTLYVEIRWQSIGIEWQNVLLALKWLHKS